MLSLLLRWIVNAGALLLVAYLYPGVHVQDFVTALVAALVLGLVNALIRPILVILTLPVTLLTLGLFLFVINAPSSGSWPNSFPASRSRDSGHRSWARSSTASSRSSELAPLPRRK
jgi:hypothetical protein